MGKLWSLPTISNNPNANDLARYATQGLTNLYQILNKNLGFRDNVNCNFKENIVIGTNTTVIPHTLNANPIGFLLIKNDQFATVKSATLAWTTSNIYLVASATCTVNMLVLGG